MDYKVFFSFQMDSDDKFGKGFIQTAIEIAIQKLKDDGINASLDFGFRGTPGTPLMIDEMLKKSSDSDIVVVDLTYTSAKEWLNAEVIDEDVNSRWISVPKIDRKPSPNPNVLLETGYAWALKGTYRTLAVMNEAFGSPNDLPVDLKGFRWGIIYNLNKFNYSEKKAKRIKLADDFYNAFKVAINSEAEYQRKKWQPLRLHKYWTPRDFKSTNYSVTPKIRKIIQQLRIDLEDKTRAQRIVGPKNSGKSRLVYELYNNIDETLLIHENREKVLYYDLEDGVGTYIQLEPKLQDLKELNQRKILILDNCPLNIHKKVFDEYIYDSNISLLSIDTSAVGEGATYFIDEDLTTEVIEQLSNESGKYKNVNFIKVTANGNLRNAITLIDSIPDGETDLPSDYNEKWKQILGADFISPVMLLLLEEISLFSYIGFTNNFSRQSDFIINQIGIKSIDEYKEIIFKLVDKGIVKITGDFIILEAFVDEFAFYRLEKLARQDIELYFTNIADVGLAKPFSKRIIELNKIKGTYKLIDVLTQKDGLLSKYDFVDSDQGAKIIMSLSELEPQKILNSLKTFMQAQSADDLMKLKSGRRYLVWSLERLVFRKETFKEASKLLYRLAKNENENIGNNSTSQFLQLFQVFLGGTQASLADRIELIKELAAESINDIILKALDRALMVHGFTRMGGADVQAGEKLIDYQPTSQEEVLDYYKSIIELLVEFKGYSFIVSRFNMQLHRGNAEAILEAVEKLVALNGKIDKDLRQQFEYVINDPRELSPDIIGKIESLLEKYNSNTLREKFEFIVALAPYSAYKTKDGETVNRSEEKVVELAKELEETKVLGWLNDIDVLLSNEQRLTFRFGQHIATLFPKNEKLIETVIDKLKAFPHKEQNNSFIAGYISAETNKDFIPFVIKCYLAEENVSYHALNMSRLVENSLEDLKKLYPVVEKNPNYVIGLNFIKINHLNPDEIEQFIDWLRQIKPYGNWVAIEICHSNFQKEVEVDDKIFQIFEKILKVEGILNANSSYNNFTFHYYFMLVKYIHQKKGLSEDFVTFLSKEIIEVTKEVNQYHSNSIIDIIEVLFDNYWDISWNTIGSSILEDDFYGWFNLKQLFEQYTRFDNIKLSEWMDNNPDNAPQKIIEIVPFSIGGVDSVEWNPLVLEMLDKFYTNQEFLRRLSGEIHSYSWSGSLVPLLESRKSLCKKLLNSKNEAILNFAKDNVTYFEKYIEKERRYDENQGFNY